MEYITQVLGVKVKRAAWNDIKKLPYLITNEYDIELVSIDNTECLFLKPLGSPETISAIKKHIARIRTISTLPVVFELEFLSRQRKKTFIDAKIAFVVPGKQLYLPFMGAVLQELADTQAAELSIDRLLPSAQMMLFCFIYGKNRPYYITEAVSALGFSAMTASRAADRLCRTGLLRASKDGVQKVLKSELTPAELFEQSKPYLINPVRKKIYIDKADVTGDMFTAGLSALAEKSRLNPPETEVYGTSRAIKPASAGAVLYDSDRQCELEIWKYNPRLLCTDNAADILSLAVSLSDTADERVEQMLHELLKGLR